MRAWTTALLAALALATARQGSAQAVQNIVLRNSFNPIGAGARGLGMGGAFIAVADDGTAVSFNPAGLSQLRRSEIAVVGFHERLDSTVNARRPGAPGSETQRSRHGALDFFGVAVPFTVGSRNLTVQLSYQRAVDLYGQGAAGFVQTAPARDLLSASVIEALRLTPDRPLELDGQIGPSQHGAFRTVTIGAGYQITPRLSLGVGFNYWIGEWDASGGQSLRVRLPRAGQPGLEVFRFEGTFDQEQNLRALNANVGLLLRYPRLSLGAVMRLPFTGDYKDIEELHAQDFLLDQLLVTRDETRIVRSRLHWPRSLGAGVALRPLRGLTVAGDYTRSRWSGAFIENVPTGALLTARDAAQTDPSNTQFVDRNFFDLLPATVTATTDTSQWRAGAEYLLTAIPKVVLPFRAGVFRDRSPVTDLTGTARRIDGWTVGTGLNFSRVVLDVAFEHRESSGVIGLRLRADQPVEGSLSTEDVKQDRFMASLIYRAGGADDPIKRLFRYLFVGPRDEGEK